MKFLKHYYLVCRSDYFFWLLIVWLFGSILLSILSQNPGVFIGFLLVFFIDIIGEYIKCLKENMDIRI